MDFVNFDELIANAPEPFRDVEVPSLGGLVRVSKLTALSMLPLITGRDEYEKKPDGTLIHDEDAAEFALDLVCASVIDPETERLVFTTEAKRAWLRSDMALWLLFPHVREVNGLNDDTAKKNETSKVDCSSLTSQTVEDSPTPIISSVN